MSKLKIKVTIPFALDLPQELEITKENEWVDKDRSEISDLPIQSVELLFAPHVLQHIPHTELVDILTEWRDILTVGGRLTIVVPDLTWVARQIVKFEQGQVLTGAHEDFEGTTGLQSLLYGPLLETGDEQQSAFTRRSLYEWLDGMNFKAIRIKEVQPEDGLGLLVATCQKPK